MPFVKSTRLGRGHLDLDQLRGDFGGGLARGGGSGRLAILRGGLMSRGCSIGIRARRVCAGGMGLLWFIFELVATCKLPCS